MSPGPFPPDQDLAPEDKSIATVVRARDSANEAKRIVQATRDAYPGPCDVVLIAVPKGKGMPFLEGLGLALEGDGKLVHRHGLDAPSYPPESSSS